MSSKKKGPKLPKHLKSLTEKNESQSKGPITAEEFLEEGSTEEESGDRWFGSDLSKALRFYQRAHESYSKSIKLQPSNNFDSYYNSSRLLFHVYNQYVKADGVTRDRLINVDEVFTGDSTSVVQTLSSTVQYHEAAISKAESENTSPPLDLLYNCALIYTEYIEEQSQVESSDFNSLLFVASKAQSLFKVVLNRQVDDIKNFVHDLDKIDNGDSEVISKDKYEASDNTGTKTSEEEYTGEEIVQPPEIMETIIAGYKLSHALLEGAENKSEINTSLSLVDPFLSRIAEVANELVLTFGQQTNKKSDFISSIETDQINDLLIHKAYTEGLTLDNLEDIIRLWSRDDIPTVADAYVSASENIQIFIDRNDINVVVPAPGVADVFWKALTSMNTSYKKAQELFTEELNNKKSLMNSESDGIGELISKISGIMIARADIDIQRSMMESYEPSIKNQKILLQNSKTLLKNAMVFANSPGGLRERAIEKMEREQKKVEAVIRMCVLENKASEKQLDEILGRQIWARELPNLLTLDYYAQVYSNMN